MSLLGEFERRLERAVEGFFARVFRSGVHPVEIGKRLMRVMEDGKVTTLRRTYVPNAYRITLSETDYQRLAPLEAKLVEELEVFVSEAAQSRGWVLADPPRVSFASGGRLSPGEFRIDGQAVAVPSGPARSPRTPSDAPEGRAESDTGPGALVVVEGEAPGRVLQLDKTIRIGRQADNDLVLSDPGVSRHHAQVVGEAGGAYLVKDLGSTNGTSVNGTKIGEHRLQNGDRIVLGHTVIEFRRSAAAT